jgi:photosystem II stability/assembly factor-like uncharacterized protein
MKTMLSRLLSLPVLAASLAWLPSIATEQWNWQYPKPQGNDLAATFFLNQDTGWIAGTSGTLFRTTDGGTSWTQQPSNARGGLNAMQFVNRDTGWAVGDSGVVLRTGNGGASWTRQNSGTGRRLAALHFPNRDTGWAVGDTGTIRKTTDGGATWTPQPLTGTVNARLAAVRFVDGSRGWITAYDGSIRKTTDGGANWVLQSSGTTNELYALHFIDSSKGFAGGYNGTLLQTTNGGTNWTIRAGVTSMYISAIHFANATAGWAVSNNNSPGDIMRTTDGGNTWGSQSSGTDQALRSVHFVSATRGWAVGADGVILKTTNGGTAWNTISSGNPPANSTSDYLRSVSFVGDIGWAVGEGGAAYKTTNGGTTWTAQASGSTTLYSSIQLLDANHGWRRARISSTEGVYYMSNGTDWVSRAGGATGFTGSLFFLDTNTGWTGGGSNTVLKTTNGGTSWTTQSLGTIITRNADKFHFVDANRGWAAGSIQSSGAIFRTTNGGTTWTNQTFSQVENMQSLSFVSPTLGWAVGYNVNTVATIFKTTDGGANWTSQTAPLDPNESKVIVDVRFIDANTGWITFGSGGILKTTDGGTTWGRQFSGTSNLLFALYFADANTGWAVGGNHTILKYTNDGPPAAPQPQSPASNAQNIPLSTTLGWSTQSAIITYRLQLSTDSTFATSLIDDSSLVTNSRNVSSLANSASYYWRVSAKNIFGTSAWSALAKFTTVPPTPVAPTLASPAANASAVAITGSLSWNASAGAATYRVQLSTDSLFATTILNDSTVTATSRATPTLANNTAYFWRVNAKNAGGTSPYSEIRKFTTTLPAAPAAPTLASPAANATGIAVSSNLSWNASAGAVTYRVQLSTDSTFAATLINDSTVTALTRATGTLANNTAYFWRVNAKNAGGSSAWSETRKFTIAPVALLPSDFVFREEGLRGDRFVFGLPRRSRVTLTLFDAKGHLVRRVLDEDRDAGYHTVALAAGGTLAGSYYLLDFRAEGYRKTLKIRP